MTDASPTPAALSHRLVAALGLAAVPIAISFRDVAAADVPAIGAPRAAPNAAGRTGAVAAGCVFWMQATQATFATTAADHGNCSVGSLTHGLITVAEAATRDDVGALLESGWVDEAAVASLPRVTRKPAAIVYGPLADAVELPDVVLVRLDALGLMTLLGAVPDLRIEGRPQCHIVAIAKERGQIAASVGCALSRARTGMSAAEMTCTIPGAQLAAIVERTEATRGLDRAMARYAAADARRFR